VTTEADPSVAKSAPQHPAPWGGERCCWKRRWLLGGADGPKIPRFQCPAGSNFFIASPKSGIVKKSAFFGPFE